MALVALCTAGCGQPADEARQVRIMMGTLVEICVADRNMSSAAKSAAIDSAFERIAKIEELMSSYKDTSDVSRINSSAYKRPVTVSAETMEVIKKSKQINELTNGAFDITVAPLVKLWGFGPKMEFLKPPSDEEIAAALNLVGMDNIKVDYAKRTVRFSREGILIDLSGIAKGYAVDCAAGVLKKHGVKNAMVNAGGDIFCMGTDFRGKPWKIGIRHPRIKNRIIGAVSLSDRAIATSGDYERFFLQGKNRISHIIDPATGRPVSDVPDSATIIAQDCATADGLATAAFVLGPQKGIEALNKIGSVKGMIVTDNGKFTRIYKTDGFAKE